MSSRRPTPAQSTETALRLRQELEALKNTAQQVEVAGAAAEAETMTVTNAAFDQLSGAEQAAGSLGVHPEAWKPIKFMNNKHYEQLLTSNALDDNLARRIEAFRHVATNA